MEKLCRESFARVISSAAFKAREHYRESVFSCFLNRKAVKHNFEQTLLNRGVADANPAELLMSCFCHEDIAFQTSTPAKPALGQTLEQMET